MGRYLEELDFRYNAREVSDVERRDMTIAGIGGKRFEVPGLMRKAVTR